MDNPGISRLVGLDGLRAIAVVAVLLFHADLAWARGGYLGVDLFFVISGFLITGLLLGEQERNGHIGLLQFYWRRAKRLLPASWLMVGITIIAAAFIAADALPRLRADALASLGYVTNWELIYSGQSYFEAMGRQPLLLHLWSLAIEEQFYLLWAPLVFLVLPRLGKRNLVFIAIGFAMASVAWMALHDADPTRLYFGTDTHGFALLIGASLGLLWRPNLLRRFGRATNMAIFGLGVLSLAGLLMLMVGMGEETSWLYPWGFLLAACVSATLIIAVTFRGSPLGRLVDNRPMRWIGERSYGIYLWHWPIFMLTRPDIDLQLDPVSNFLLRMALTVIIAGLSYRFIERPIREGALGKLRNWGKAITAIPSAALVAAASAILIMAPSQAAPPKDVADAIGNVASIAPPDDAKPQTQLVAEKKVVAAEVTASEVTGSELTALGDSVLLGASRVLQAAMPGARVYAAVSKQAEGLLKELRGLRNSRKLTPVVLIHLGTNGYVTEDELRSMLSLLREQQRVLIMNSHVPRPWMRPNNSLIERVLPDYPNAALVDWDQISQRHPEFFVSDGVHLTLRGQKAFLAGIRETLHPRRPE